MDIHFKAMGSRGLIRGDSNHRWRSGWFDVVSLDGEPMIHAGKSQLMAPRQATLTLPMPSAAPELVEIYTTTRHLAWAAVEIAYPSGPTFWYRFDEPSIEDLKFGPGAEPPTLIIEIYASQSRMGAGLYFGVDSVLGLRPPVATAKLAW